MIAASAFRPAWWLPGPHAQTLYPSLCRRRRHPALRRERLELPDGDILADGRTEIEKIEDHFAVRFPEGEFETLGGLILHEIRKIPVTGETVRIENLDMVVESADERSIKKVRIKRLSDNQNGPGM